MPHPYVQSQLLLECEPAARPAPAGPPASIAASPRFPKHRRLTLLRDPNSPIEPQFAEDQSLIDFLTGIHLQDRPEERIRQRYLRILHHQYGYSKTVLAREVPIYHGSSQATDQTGNPVFADIVVYEDEAACLAHDQGRVRFVVELKKPDETRGHNQLVSYVFLTSANGAVWTNGDDIQWYRRHSTPENRLVPWPGIPRPGEAWDAVGRRRKQDLRPLRDVRGTLERCHNKLHRRGAEGEDLTMDMVRILLAKARDETRDGDDPLFYCTGEEYPSDEGRHRVAARIQSLFAEVRDQNPTVFEPTERILVGDRQVAEVVVELQDYALVGDEDLQWDLMGAAYEQYTAEVMKREGGQFFTNRLVVDFLTRILDPGPDELMLDPAGGTGGFCTATIRHMRRTIRESSATGPVKRRRRDQIRDRVFYIEISRRLVKIAKAAMILTGDGHRGFVRGDSLARFDRLPADWLARCRPGVVDIVLTNPPFAGTVNGKIDQPEEMVPQFELARRWAWEGERYVPTAEPLPGGVPPEILFIERCLQWLKPGGTLGIVVPKGILENPEVSLAVRHFIFRYGFVRAVITMHKHTFQPYTGSRTALLVIQKKPNPELGEQPDYPIFMALSRKIGQDSEGAPIFSKDENGHPTEELDHDLDEIFEAWEMHRAGTLEPSDYAFSVARSALDAHSLNVSPQAHQPSFNEAIARVLRIGDSDRFVAVPLGEITTRISKGQRYKREDLETDQTEGASVVRYYTPAALLQDRPESIKYLDLSRATSNRRTVLERHRLRRLQLLITRSGSIGRVILTTKHQEGHLGTDDLIHVEIDEPNLRAYVYAFLKSELGQKLLKKNEYGTIQQHLEPAHVRELLIPLPITPGGDLDQGKISTIGSIILGSIETKERSIDEEDRAATELEALFPDDESPL
jgi:type I restriction enzyme M protein